MHGALADACIFLVTFGLGWSAWLLVLARRGGRSPGNHLLDMYGLSVDADDSGRARSAPRQIALKAGGLLVSVGAAFGYSQMANWWLFKLLTYSHSSPLDEPVHVVDGSPPEIAVLAALILVTILSLLVVMALFAMTVRSLLDSLRSPVQRGR